jgi:hypothetical protein
MSLLRRRGDPKGGRFAYQNLEFKISHMLHLYIQQFAEILAKELPLSQEEIFQLIEIPPENIP